jgi:hypothetical protein
MALEMLRCILNGITGNISAGFGEKTRNSHVTSSQDDKILESALLSHFYSKQMTQSLLNLLISRSFPLLLLCPSFSLTIPCSSWDKTRSLAAEILLLMPRPLPGYETPAAVASLWRWGCNLSGSAKQRESDSGLPFPFPRSPPLNVSPSLSLSLQEHCFSESSTSSTHWTSAGPLYSTTTKASM